MQSSKSLISSVQKALKSFEGSYGLGIISSKYPDQIIAARKGSPLGNRDWVKMEIILHQIKWRFYL